MFKCHSVFKVHNINLSVCFDAPFFTHGHVIKHAASGKNEMYILQWKTVTV